MKRRGMAWVAAVVLALWLGAGACLAETTMQQSVTQRGITWTFDKECKVGQFANGDFAPSPGFAVGCPADPQDG